MSDQRSCATRHLVPTLLVSLLAATSASAQPAGTSRPWWERITFSGDMRLRYEGFYQEDVPTRNRARFRMRFGFGGEVNDEVRFGVRLASGEAGDAASTNQSMTDLFSRKPINIDRAFLAYTPEPAPALTVGGGKFGYPVARTQMTWDDDVNWEGVYQEVETTRGETSFKLVGVQSVLAESGSGDDAAMFVVYGEVGMPVGGHALQISVGNYGFREVDRIAVGIDRDPELLKGRNTNAVRRNAAGQVLGFVSRFNMLDVIAEARLATGRPEYPVTIVADWVINTRAADDHDTGVWIETAYGRAAQPETYQVEYTFARIERDAVISPYTFSDIPGTNVTMNRFVFSYMPRPRLNLDVTSILTKDILVAPGDPNHLLHRLQVDARISF